MFSQYNPLENKMYRVMDDEGVTIKDGWENSLSDEDLIRLYNKMLFARTADQMAVSYQRQGRMFTYPPNIGQEAIAVAAGKVVQREDWVVPAFRELALWLEKGATMKDVFLLFRGDEWGTQFRNGHRLLPISVPISSQLPHAVGIAYSMKYNKENSVVFAFVGDGGTSEGDFHEALNFAAVWQVPVVFVIQNNQFAISVPVREQTVSVNLAVKGVAYGMPGIKVDGNDVLAMYDVLREAREYAGSGKGPVLIEALTYRKGAHTTSDDPTRYRTKDEEDEWDKKDPLKRFSLFLQKRGLWNELEEESLIEEYKKKIDLEFAEAESTEYKFEDIFAYNYAVMPDELKRQKMKYEQFLKWKEAEK